MKWLFDIDNQIYQNYLNELTYFIQKIIGVEDSSLLKILLENHGKTVMIVYVSII
jgi:hypothetical protein